MNKIVLFLLLVMGGGCSASYHAKRAIKKNPQAFKADTTIVVDTLVIEVPKIDTTFVYDFDTVEVIVDDVKIKYHYDTLTRETYIEADCPDQEVLTETKTITLPPIIIKPSIWDRISSGLIIAAVILGILLLIKLFK